MTNVVVISDGHAGHLAALCPPKIRMGLGGVYERSYLQDVLWDWWREFEEWVNKKTKGKYYLIYTGDGLEGDHHRSKEAISLNMATQMTIARKILDPFFKRAIGSYYIMGTCAHGGEAGENEETLAEELNAIPHPRGGNFARPHLRRQFEGVLFDASHYIGVTGNMQYQTSAPMAEMNRILVACSKNNLPVPRVVIRAHRHTHIKIPIETAHGIMTFFTTPCWKLKDTYLYGVAGGSTIIPEIGGAVVQVDGNEYQDFHFVRRVEQDEIEGDVDEHQTNRVGMDGRAGEDAGRRPGEGIQVVSRRDAGHGRGQE